jgi:hypothetical protein
MKKGLPFHLIDENTRKRYYFQTTFESDEEFDDFTYSSEFEQFMDMMECGTKNGLEPWSGVHDVDGEVGFPIGYSSYEIKDFDTAIKMWFDFFEKHGKLLEGSVIKTEIN